MVHGRHSVTPGARSTGTVALWASVACAILGAADARAMCNVIPGVTNEFRGALGSLNRPYAIPGDNGEQIEITLEPSACTGASPGFGRCSRTLRA